MKVSTIELIINLFKYVINTISDALKYIFPTIFGMTLLFISYKVARLATSTFTDAKEPTLWYGAVSVFMLITSIIVLCSAIWNMFSRRFNW